MQIGAVIWEIWGAESAAYAGWAEFAAWGKRFHLTYDLMPYP